MTVISVVSIGMMQADINAEIDLVILRVPPARIDDLVCICRGINGTIGDAIIHAIVTIIIDPIAQAIRPVSALPALQTPGWGGGVPGGGGDGQFLLLHRL